MTRDLSRRLPNTVRRRLSPVLSWLSPWPPVGLVRLGSLRRARPVSTNYGFDRGTPIDRYYIERFLQHAGCNGNPVRGRVLEIGEARYAPRLSGREGIERLDILDLSPTNSDATIVADLTEAPQLESDAFDCVICTQTLHLIYEVEAATATLHRILKPEGTLLVSVPGISQICRAEMDTIGDHWRFTSRSATRLFEEVFGPGRVRVETHGNVLAAAGFLYGLSTEDLREQELEFRDPNYELVIGIEAVKEPSSEP